MASRLYIITLQNSIPHIIKPIPHLIIAYWSNIFDWLFIWGELISAFVHDTHTRSNQLTWIIILYHKRSCVIMLDWTPSVIIQGRLNCSLLKGRVKVIVIVSMVFHRWWITFSLYTLSLGLWNLLVLVIIVSLQALILSEVNEMGCLVYCARITRYTYLCLCISLKAPLRL